MNNQSGNPKGMMNNTDLIKRFLDMANCADASYAMLHYALTKDIEIADNDKSDGLTLGYESPINKKWISTYARAIEANFNEKKVIKEGRFSNATLGNDITKIPKDTPHDQISQRTKDFVSRFELLKHRPDDETSGFSATLLKTQKQEFQGVFGA